MKDIEIIGTPKNVFNYETLSAITKQIRIDFKNIFKWTRYNFDEFHFNYTLEDGVFNKYRYDSGYGMRSLVYNLELAETIDLSFYPFDTHHSFFIKKIIRKINNSLKLENYSEFTPINFKLVHVELNSLGSVNAPCFSLVYSRTQNLPHIQRIKDKINKYQNLKNTCTYTNDAWNNYNNEWILANNELKKITENK